MPIGIIFAHADLAQGLLEAVKAILGKAEGLRAFSNRELQAKDLALGLSSMLAEVKLGEKAIVFTDLYGGSCSNACRKVVQGRKDVAVICGVNLPILLEFCLDRSRMDFEALIDHLIRVGQRAIIKL
jgi:mannose/fructose-specific phosphotransferase system component IIA